jgi:valyl-tRNA synthetase
MFMNAERIGVYMRSTKVAAGIPSEEGMFEEVLDQLSYKIPVEPGTENFKAATLEDRWIISRFNLAAAEVSNSLSGFIGGYRFDNAANTIYDFFWGELCDWYIELLKPRLSSLIAEEAILACKNLVILFEASLRLLHPIMPFITEELWHAMFVGSLSTSIAFASYPEPDGTQSDLIAETQMSILQDLIVSIRNLRAELKVEPRMTIDIELFSHDPQTWILIQQNEQSIKRLANAGNVSEVNQTSATKQPSRSTARFDVRLVYEQKIDVGAECERLKKEMEKIEKGIASGQRQLGNEQFLAKAPVQVVENLKKQQQELAVLHQKTQSKLNELGCA